MSEPAYITRREAADILNTSRQRIFQLIRDKEVRTKEVYGGKVLVSRADIMKRTQDARKNGKAKQ